MQHSGLVSTGIQLCAKPLRLPTHGSACRKRYSSAAALLAAECEVCNRAMWRSIWPGVDSNANWTLPHSPLHRARAARALSKGASELHWSQLGAAAPPAPLTVCGVRVPHRHLVCIGARRVRLVQAWGGRYGTTHELGSAWGGPGPGPADSARHGQPQSARQRHGPSSATTQPHLTWRLGLHAAAHDFVSRLPRLGCVQWGVGGEGERHVRWVRKVQRRSMDVGAGTSRASAGLPPHFCQRTCGAGSMGRQGLPRVHADVPLLLQLLADRPLRGAGSVFQHLLHPRRHGVHHACGHAPATARPNASHMRSDSLGCGPATPLLW